MIEQVGCVVVMKNFNLQNVPVMTFFAERDCNGTRLCVECGCPIIARVYYIVTQYCCSFNCACQHASTIFQTQSFQVHNFLDRETIIHPEICAVCGDIADDNGPKPIICSLCRNTYWEIEKASRLEPTTEQIISDCRQGFSPADIAGRDEGLLCKRDYEAGHVRDCSECNVPKKWCLEPHKMDNRYRGKRMSLPELKTDL
jgi:hypothetical protein